MIDAFMEFMVIFMMVIVVIISIAAPFFIYFLILMSIINNIKRNKTQNYFKQQTIVTNPQDNTIESKKNIYIDVDKNKLKTFNTDDINALKDYFYEIFYKFETAYNNLDYNAMKMLSTSQLYNNYHTGITLDLKVGKKRIINDIQRINVILYELDSTPTKQVASLMIEVSYIIYTLDSKGYVISGSKDKPVNEKFDITFRKDFEKKPLTNCPNCGAHLDGSKCSYCGSIIKDVEFKISSIKRIIG